MSRFRAGFDDGSGLEMVIDTTQPEGGKIIAVTNHGCGCCKPDTTLEHAAQAVVIATALNSQERYRRMEQALLKIAEMGTGTSSATAIYRAGKIAQKALKP